MKIKFNFKQDPILKNKQKTEELEKRISYLIYEIGRMQRQFNDNKYEKRVKKYEQEIKKSRLKIKKLEEERKKMAYKMALNKGKVSKVEVDESGGEKIPDLEEAPMEKKRGRPKQSMEEPPMEETPPQEPLVEIPQEAPPQQVPPQMQPEQAVEEGYSKDKINVLVGLDCGREFKVQVELKDVDNFFAEVLKAIEEKKAFQIGTTILSGEHISSLSLGG